MYVVYVGLDDGINPEKRIPSYCQFKWIYYKLLNIIKINVNMWLTLDVDIFFVVKYNAFF